MKKEKVLVLGTAPDKFVKDGLGVLQDDGIDIHLVVNKERRDRFKDQCKRVYGVNGRIYWHNFPLFLLYLWIRPSPASRRLW